MKITFPFVAMNLFILSLSAQNNIDIQLDYDPGNSYSGQTVVHQSTGAYFEIPMKVINFSSDTINILFRRVILVSDVSVADQFCDATSCYSCGSDNVWSSEMVNYIPGGDTSIMKPQGSFTGFGFANFRYYILNSSNEEIMDSVDINLSYNSSTDMREKEYFKTVEYPNPANKIFMIECENISASNCEIKMYNIAGQNMLQQKLSYGLNVIRLDKIIPGIYFYTISNNEKVRKTKKLIIR